MRILSIDCSTTTIGLSVLDFNSKKKAKLVHLSHYKPIKHQLPEKEFDFLNTISLAKQHLIGLIEQYKPDIISIEEYIRYLGGGSGAATIIPLAILNRSLCLMVQENYPQIQLKISNVISIRSQIKRALNLPSLPQKEELPSHLEQLLKIKIPILTKETRKGLKTLPETYDQSDAIAVAYYTYTQLEKKQ